MKQIAMMDCILQAFSFFKPGDNAIRRLVILTAVSFSSIILYSQNIAGRWQGKSYWPGIEGDTAKLYLEIRNDSSGNHFMGFSVAIYKEFYGKTALYGYYDDKSAKYILIEDETLESGGNKKVNVILDKYVLSLRPEGTQALYGTIECDSHTSKMDKLNWYCANDRAITFYRTIENIPPVIKRKVNRVRIIKN